MNVQIGYDDPGLLTTQQTLLHSVYTRELKPTKHLTKIKMSLMLQVTLVDDIDLQAEDGLC